MKHKRDSHWTVILVIVSVLVWGWNVLVMMKAETLMLMFNTAAPSSALYEKTLKSVCADSTKLLLFAALPMAIVTLLWALAFMREREKKHRLEKQLRDLQPGPDR